MDRSAAQPDPPYLRIVAEIRRRIAAGELAHGGDRVPSAPADRPGMGRRPRDRHQGAGRSARQEGLVQRRAPRRDRGPAARARHPRRNPSHSTIQAHRQAAHAPDQELSPRSHRAHAAIAMADTEGLDRANDAAHRAELGVGTMSLYRHVPGKDELVLLMADAVFGEAQLPSLRPPGWRAQLELTARAAMGRLPAAPLDRPVVSMTRPTAGTQRDGLHRAGAARGRRPRPGPLDHAVCGDHHRRLCAQATAVNLGVGGRGRAGHRRHPRRVDG